MDVGQTAKQLVHVHLMRGEDVQKDDRRMLEFETGAEKTCSIRQSLSQSDDLTFTYMIGMMLLALLKCLATL